jgi:hypothetical protein
VWEDNGPPLGSSALMPKCVDPTAPPVGTLGCGVIQPTVFTLTHSQASRHCCPAHKRPQSG